MAPTDATTAAQSAAKKGRSASRESQRRGQKRSKTKSPPRKPKETASAIDEDKFEKAYAEVIFYFMKAQRAEQKEARLAKATTEQAAAPAVGGLDPGDFAAAVHQRMEDEAMLSKKKGSGLIAQAILGPHN